jgi:hypothetical protein
VVQKQVILIKKKIKRPTFLKRVELSINHEDYILQRFSSFSSQVNPLNKKKHDSGD